MARDLSAAVAGQQPLPLEISYDQQAYDAERRRRREICEVAGHRVMRSGANATELVCVRCLERSSLDLSE